MNIDAAETTDGPAEMVSVDGLEHRITITDQDGATARRRTLRTEEAAMSRLEVQLNAELPDVEVEPLVLRVQCGESVCYVKEHGYEGSGAWAAWTGSHILPHDPEQRPAAGTKGYSRDQAVRDATAEVRRRERTMAACSGSSR